MNVEQRHLDSYREQGYVVFRDALDDADLGPLIDDHEQIVDEMARDLGARGKVGDLAESAGFDRRLARLAEQCPEVDNCPDIGFTRRRGTFEFLRNANLLDLIEPFVGPEITWNPVSHVRPKMPGTDVAFHQDAVFTAPEAKDILQVTVWLPLVEATEENGCLQVMPGVHSRGTVYWTYSKDLPPVEPVALPMRKGDVLIMHKLTPHGSGPNATDAVRWSMDLRYQKTGDPSPRPEWPSLVARSRRDPRTETEYEAWRDEWAAATARTPEQLRYPRPDRPLPFGGEMYYEG